MFWIVKKCDIHPALSTPLFSTAFGSFESYLCCVLFYNTNKISLCVHRSRTRHTLCSKSLTRNMLVIHVLPNEVPLQIRDFVQTHIYTPT